MEKSNNIKRNPRARSMNPKLEMAQKQEELEKERRPRQLKIHGIPHSRLTQFQLDFLQSHNKYRALHTCPPLRMSLELNALALDWAQKIANGRKQPVLPEGADYGMNLYYSAATTVNGKDAPTEWYRLSDKFNYNKPLEKKFIHREFAQLIWKSTTLLGCGQASMRRGKQLLVVGIYQEKSASLWSENAEDAYKTNVPRPLALLRAEIREKIQAEREARRAKYGF